MSENYLQKDKLVSFLCDNWCKTLNGIYYNARREPITDDYTGTARFGYFIYQKQGFFGWKNDTVNNQKKEQERLSTEKDVQNAKSVLDALDINYTIKKYTEPKPLTTESRTFHYNTDIAYTIPKENIAPVWETLHECKMLNRKNSSHGWAEKLKDSEAAQTISNHLFQLYQQALTALPGKLNKSIRFKTENRGVIGEYILGEPAYTFDDYMIFFSNLGYKDLATEDQRVGLEYVVVESLISKRKEIGAEYVEVIYDDPSVTLSPYFPKELLEKNLKDW